jgi:hypothetical protein
MNTKSSLFWYIKTGRRNIPEDTTLQIVLYLSIHRRKSALVNCVFFFLYFFMAVQPFGPWLLFSFLIIFTVGRTPWTEDRAVARPLPTHRTTQTHHKSRHTDIHASSEIRTCDPRVRAGEDVSCLRPRRHCDRLLRTATSSNFLWM